MSKLIDDFATAIKQVIIDLFTPADGGFGDQYLQGTANAFETPARNSQRVQDVLIFNNIIFQISVGVMVMLIMGLTAKVVIDGAGSSQILKTTIRSIIGITFLAYNIEIVFMIFEFTDGFVSALSWARVYYDSQTAANTFGGPIGAKAIATATIQQAFLAMKILGYLFTYAAIGVIWLSLELREILLLGVLAFAPLMAVLWSFGPLVGLGRVGAGVASRALFFVIPLIMLLTLVEIVNPGGGIPLFSHLLKSSAILAVTWISVKVSAVGRIVTSATKTAVGSAVLLGGAAAVGGTGLATRAGLSKALGRPGYMMAKAMESNQSGESSQRSTATTGDGTLGVRQGRNDYTVALYADNPDDKIREKWDERPPTIENDGYFDNTRHAPDVNPVEGANQPSVTETDDHSREDLLYARNENLTDPDFEKLDLADREAIGNGDNKLKNRGVETNEPDIQGDPWEETQSTTGDAQ